MRRRRRGVGRGSRFTYAGIIGILDLVALLVACLIFPGTFWGKGSFLECPVGALRVWEHHLLGRRFCIVISCRGGRGDEYVPPATPRNPFEYTSPSVSY